MQLAASPGGERLSGCPAHCGAAGASRGRGGGAGSSRAGGESPVPGTGMDLERAIAGLPKGARMVFVLHDVEGYQHEEIAKMTGIASGTSKAQLFRARRLLREALSR